MSGSIGLNETLITYVQSANPPEHPVLVRCREETDAMGDVSRMQISPEQGVFLQMCARLTRARIAVEIGVFTGYSALATALVMQEMHGNAARLIGCDISEDYTAPARRYWAEAGVADIVELRIGEARETLERLTDEIGGTVDMAFIDADKTGYDDYYEACLALMRPGGLILFDNMLWNGDVADPAKVASDADTAALRALAAKVRDDGRVHVAFTAIGDGLLMAMKR
jgi:caffeoyl-CoA O-methyltransferase